MTPKEKALSLYAEYHKPLSRYKDSLNIIQIVMLQQCAKQCALIAVNEILKGTFLITSPASFWVEVKHEIENI